jgi:HCNGP-like protein
VLSPSLQNRVDRLLANRQRGRHFNDALQNMKSFMNPSMVDTVAEAFDIDQTGSNYPPSVYDPHDIQDNDYFDAILKQQQSIDHQHQLDMKKRSAVSFTSGTSLEAAIQQQRAGREPARSTIASHVTATHAAPTAPTDRPRKRRSRFDQ